MKIALFCLGLLALPACSGVQPGKGDGAASAAYERIVFAGDKATTDERAACESVGGEVVPSGKLQWENCVQTFSDAGKACSGESDCIGECRHEGEEAEPGSFVTGTCQATDARFGCRTVVEDGKIAHTLCVD